MNSATTNIFFLFHERSCISGSMGVSQGMCLEVGLLDIGICVSSPLVDNAKLFSKVLVPIYTPSVCMKMPIDPYPWQHLMLSDILVLLN